MYSYSDIKQLHIEITNLCNAACPSCARNDRGGATLPWLALTQIRLEQFKDFFSEDFILQLRKIVFCGSYGDPSMAHELLDICAHVFKLNPELSIQLNTNGGARTEQWWAQLAKILGKNSKVIFSIDGLGDTNHIYRRGVVWEKLIKNVVSFISAGGIAEWDYLIFQHNQHQITEAKELAIRLGFKEFVAKKALGFDLGPAGKLEEMTVLKEDGSYDYSIYPYTQEVVGVNEDEVKFNAVLKLKKIARYASDGYTRDFIDLNTLAIEEGFEKKAATCSIDCHAKKYKEIYVAADGRVFPCCFMGSQFYLAGKYNFENKQTQQFFDEIDINQQSLYKNTLRNIITSEWFQKKIPSTWALPSLRDGKLSVCSSYCGKEFNKLDSITYNRSSQLKTT